MITRRSADRGTMFALLGVLAAIALALAGCGGSSGESAGDGADTSSTTDTEMSESVEEDESSEEAAIGGGGEGAVTLEFRGQTYDFATDVSCNIFADDNLAVGGGRYGEGTYMSLTKAQDVLLVRVSVDGQDWEQASRDVDPVVSGSTVTWTGEIQADGSGEMETVTITGMC